MTESPVLRKHDRYKASSYRSYNDKMLSRYDTCLWQRFCQTALWDRTVVEELLTSNGRLRILDVGCATGRLLEQLTTAGATELAGIDLAPRIVEVARQKLAKTGVAVELQSGDAEDSLPWDADAFDAVTLTGVLHHFYRPRDALVEIRRILRPGGRLLVVDPCFFPPLRQIFNLALRIAPHAGDFHFYSPHEAAELLAAAGLEIKGTCRVGWSAFLVDARERED